MWYVGDRQGSVQAALDGTGHVVAQAGYDGTGNVTSGGTLVDRYGYAGMEYDASTGLYADRARQYDPSTGRFLEEDPLGQGPNPYSYAANAAPNGTDPSGMEDKPILPPRGNSTITCHDNGRSSQTDFKLDLKMFDRVASNIDTVKSYGDGLYLVVYKVQGDSRQAALYQDVPYRQRIRSQIDELSKQLTAVQKANAATQLGGALFRSKYDQAGRADDQAALWRNTDTASRLKREIAELGKVWETAPERLDVEVGGGSWGKDVSVDTILKTYDYRTSKSTCQQLLDAKIPVWKTAVSVNEVYEQWNTNPRLAEKKLAEAVGSFADDVFTYYTGKGLFLMARGAVKYLAVRGAAGSIERAVAEKSASDNASKLAQELLGAGGPGAGSGSRPLLSAQQLHSLAVEEYAKRFLLSEMQTAKALKAELGPAVSIAQDKVTGKISKVHFNNQQGGLPSNLSDPIVSRLKTVPESVKTKGPGSHAEVYAVDELLKARPGAKMGDIQVLTLEIDLSSRCPLLSFKPACNQCDHLLQGVEYLK